MCTGRQAPPAVHSTDMYETIASHPDAVCYKDKVEPRYSVHELSHEPSICMDRDLVHLGG